MQSAVKSALRTGYSVGSVNPLAPLVAALFLLSAVFALPAAAQEEGPVGFSDDELQAFAAATLEVEKVQAKWQPQLSNAKSAEENTALRQEAIEEMTQVVREQGLSVGQYNAIHAAAQQHPKLMETVEEYREGLE